LGNFQKNVELEKYNPFFVGQPRLFTSYVLDGKKVGRDPAGGLFFMYIFSESTNWIPDIDQLFTVQYIAGKKSGLADEKRIIFFEPDVFLKIS
jgi:hypothetical protein